MQFSDATPLAGTRMTADGYLVADAFAVRTGVQLYHGSECGKPEMQTVRVYRPEDEVRSPKSLSSFSHAPVTLGHPTVAVTADNWKDLAKGEVSTEATWDGNRIKLPLIVKDAATIAAIHSGIRELSAGYTCELDFTDGVTPQGEPYDAVQRGIVINHLAIVPRGRAGTTRIGDADHWGASPVTSKSTERDVMSDAFKTVVLGDKAAQVAVADAPIIEQFKADAAKALTDTKAVHDVAMAAKDGELATKDAKIAELTKAVVSDADLDKRVADRAALIAKVALVAKDVAPAGLSDAAIKKAAVIAVRGAAMADKSDAYIDAAFDLLTEDKADPLAKVIVKTADANELSKLYDQRNMDLSNAWNPQAKKEA